MQNSDPRDRIVYPIHKLMIDSYTLRNKAEYAPRLQSWLQYAVHKAAEDTGKDGEAR